VPIPGGNGENKKDAEGNAVVSRLNEENLEKLARATGGSYLRATSAALDPAPVVRQIDRMEKRTIESQSLSTLAERFQWPLALAVLALLLHLGAGPFKALTSGRVVPPLPVREGGRGGPGGEGSPVAARLHLFPLAVLLGWAALPSLPWQPHLPAWAERWMYNPRERMERTIESYGRKQHREAVKTADTALRLAPGDPRVQYDAGTAHLAAGQARKSVPMLEKAAKGADAQLSPAAKYNLGNARLAAGDAAGAVEAYKQTLREQPGNPDAKYNLELALREEQKQKMGGRGNPAGSRGSRANNQDPSNQQGKGNNPQQQPPPQKGNPPPNPQQGRQGQPGDQQKPGNEGQDDRLPQFRNQPDMNAREAASVLSAVENLERQQRRDQAARRARQKSARGKDW
jgi:Ca-activated chloride channel family protein